MKIVLNLKDKEFKLIKKLEEDEDFKEAPKYPKCKLIIGESKEIINIWYFQEFEFKGELLNIFIDDCVNETIMEIVDISMKEKDVIRSFKRDEIIKLIDYDGSNDVPYKGIGEFEKVEIETLYRNDGCW